MNQEQLFSLLQSFASLAPVKNLEWPSAASADEIQEFLIEQLVFSEHFQSYPPSANYRRSFWKWAIANIEEQGEEVKEEIYSYYLTLLDKSSTEPVSLAQPPPPSYVTYIWDDLPRAPTEKVSEVAISNCRRCTLFEARTTIESGTTGLRTWTASFVLAEYLLSNSLFNEDLVETSRILELGSGAGFVGIILAQLQTEALGQSAPSSPEHESRPSLYLTDLNEQVLARCESNVKLACNNVLSHPELRFRAMDWSDALDETRKVNLSASLNEAKADLIIGADVVYDVAIIPSLVAMLHLAFNPSPTNPSGKRAIIAATLRNESTLDAFVQKVREAELCIEEIEVVQDGYSSRFLQSQPDRIGESGSHVKVFAVTSRIDL